VIRDAYRPVQDTILKLYSTEYHPTRERFGFNRRVTAYLVVLFVGAAAYVIVLGVYLLNELVDEG
jgi:hypothetical protein